MLICAKPAHLLREGEFVLTVDDFYEVVAVRLYDSEMELQLADAPVDRFVRVGMDMLVCFTEAAG